MTNKTLEADQPVVFLIKYQTARSALTDAMASPTFSRSSHYSFDSAASSSAMSSSSELEETETSSSQRTIRGIGPAQDSSRRRSMAIQDMLNPEENDSRSQSVLSSSSFGGRGRLTPTSEHSSSAMQYSPSPSQKPRQRVSLSKMRHDRRNRQSAERSGKSPSPTPSDVSARTTKYRAPYSTEEAHFIWFHKVDLKKKWPEIEIAFQSQYPNSRARNKDGLSSRYYRINKDKNFPRVRPQNEEKHRIGEPATKQKYGMWASTGQRYPWMEPYASDIPGSIISPMMGVAVIDLCAGYSDKL